jgi:hypothetical protein
MKRVHLWVGLAGVVTFLGTGQYMAIRLGHLHGVDALPRMLYRSGHIYLLMGSLLNLLLGLYLAPSADGWRRWVIRIGSALIVVAPLAFLAGFATEPVRTDFNRPFAAPAIFGCLFGVLLHAIAHVPRGTDRAGTPKGAPYETV